MDLIGLLITLIVLGVLFYIAVWFIDWIALPDPFNKLIKVVVGLICLIYLLGMFGGFVMPVTHYWGRHV